MMQNSGTTASLRGLSVVDGQTAWASGTGATVIRTVDGGDTWTSHPLSDSIRDVQDLDFRDIQAFDGRNAIVFAAGSPALAFRTDDGGINWKRVYRNDHERAFFDGMAFWNADHGIAFSDPIGGHLLLIRSNDGGHSWHEQHPSRCPTSLPGEAGFAASGTGLAVSDMNRVWIGLGGATGEDFARVVRSEDGARTWHAASTPIRTSESAGVFSIAFANRERGVAVGGDYRQPEDSSSNLAVTADGGRSWTQGSKPPRGYRSAVAVATVDNQTVYVAVGPSGADLSRNDGHDWAPLTDEAFHTVAFAPGAAVGWSTGVDGRVARWQLASPSE